MDVVCSWKMVVFTLCFRYVRSECRYLNFRANATSISTSLNARKGIFSGCYLEIERLVRAWRCQIVRRRRQSTKRSRSGYRACLWLMGRTPNRSRRLNGSSPASWSLNSTPIPFDQNRDRCNSLIMARRRRDNVTSPNLGLFFVLMSLPFEEKRRFLLMKKVSSLRAVFERFCQNTSVNHLSRLEGGPNRKKCNDQDMKQWGSSADKSLWINPVLTSWLEADASTIATD